MNVNLSLSHVLVVSSHTSYKMATQFIFPVPFSFSNGNISENWKIFKQEVKLQLIATERLKKLNNVKTSILLTCTGKQGCQIYNNFKYSLEYDQMKYDIVMNKF